jgi:peroxiredoxin
MLRTESIPNPTSEVVMAINVGDAVPDIEVRVLDEGGMPTSVQTGDVLGAGKVVLFAVPGAFTTGCTMVHLPTFVEGASDLAGEGVDTIACIAVNDAWVMGAWGKAHGSDDITMLADGNGEFAAAMGLTMDGSGFGLGSRSKRYAAVIEDGTITHLAVDEGGIELSTCSAVLDAIVEA